MGFATFHANIINDSIYLMKESGKKIKRGLNYFGGLIALTGAILIVFKLKAYAHEIDFLKFSVADWLSLCLLAIIYGAANILLARSWWHLLIYFKVNTLFNWAMKAYGMSQLGKYVPGNIFHLASRQTMGMAVNIQTVPLAKSIIWELGIIAFAGALFVPLIVPIFMPIISFWISVIFFLCLVVVSGTLICRMLSVEIASALIGQVMFLAVSGGVFIGVLAVIDVSIVSISNLTALCGAYVIAWLLGLITPGAPAGLGVREIVLLFLLGSYVPNTDLLLAIVLGRIVTVIGDFLFFLFSAFCFHCNCFRQTS
ncbi:MAG TPA: hypothetical protein PK178_08010 [Smithellaceae bacterium]|nr:hypothetical protein [Smithellaceae bacterium]HPM11025.1 hypothetical protein [Paludibacter sp.]